MSAIGPAALARAAVQQQQRALADAREQLTHAATRRTEAERALAEAEAKHDAALVASAAHRSDAHLLDESSRAGVLVAHARSDVARAVEAHSAALESVSAAERHLEDARKAAERAELEASLLDPQRAARMRAHGEALVGAIVALRQKVADIVADLSADADEVAKARALGSSVEAADGIQLAGGVAFGLLAHGGSVRDDDHQLRWLCELATGPGKPEIDAVKTAAALVPYVLAALKAGATSPAYERLALQRRADLYAHHRSYTAARREEGERTQRERAQSQRDGQALAEAAMARRPAEARPRVRVIPPPARGPGAAMGNFSPAEEQKPEGAFSIGDDGVWRADAAE